MEDQRRHEMRWYAERQALKRAQEKRVKSSAEVQAILQSLANGDSGASTKANGHADPELELAKYDRKIYDAYKELQETMTAELKGLGVPFFGTDRSLVIDPDGGSATPAAAGERTKWSPLVTDSQLIELRRKMVEYLEDLYRD